MSDDADKFCKHCRSGLIDRGNGLICNNEDCKVFREINIHEEPDPTHDSVEITVVLQVKFNVERNHKHNLSNDFIRGMIQADDSADVIGDKATDRIVGVFETAGFDIQDAECKSQIAQVGADEITIDEAPEEDNEDVSGFDDDQAIKDSKAPIVGN